MDAAEVLARPSARDESLLMLGDLGEYLVNRHLAIHRERFLTVREDKRQAWCVGEGLRADNPVATLWPAAPPALAAVNAVPVASREAPRPWSAEQGDRFYCELLYALGELAQAGGTAVGAAAVAKRVALANGLTLAEWVPTPPPDPGRA